MSVQLPQPLPECLVCERPTRRDVHAATGGLCSLCNADRVTFRTRRRTR